MEKKQVRAHAVISGKVQGVFYRMETRQAAERIGVCGWVRNRSDGTVEAVFEGNADRVQSVLEWCKKGPPKSVVSDVSVTWEDYTGQFDQFSVTY